MPRKPAPTNPANAPAVVLPPDDPAWETTMTLADGTPRRLLATVVIAGVSMHVTAVRVIRYDDGNTVFCAADPEDEDEVDRVYALDDGGPFETATIGGYAFLIYATPFQD